MVPTHPEQHTHIRLSTLSSVLHRPIDAAWWVLRGHPEGCTHHSLITCSTVELAYGTRPEGATHVGI